MNQIKISVIIPVFNDEEFLEECLNSVINQSLKEIEIICVDDGSSDNSLSILNDFKEKDDRIRVFSKENGGSGSARNLGLVHARGKYIAFLDSDDYIVSQDAYQILFDEFEKYDVKMISANLQVLSKNGIQYGTGDFKPYEKISLRKTEEYGIPWLFPKNLFEREFLIQNDIKFPNLLRGQDPVFLSTVLSKLDVYLEVPLNYYSYRTLSINKLNNSKKYYDYFNGFYEVFKILTSQKRFKNSVDLFSQKLILMKKRSPKIDDKRDLLKFIKISEKILDLFDAWGNKNLLIDVVASFRDLLLKIDLQNVKIIVNDETALDKSFFKNISIVYSYPKDSSIGLTTHKDSLFFRNRIFNSFKKENQILKDRLNELDKNKVIKEYFYQNKNLFNALDHIYEDLPLIYDRDILKNIEDLAVLDKIFSEISKFSICNNEFYSFKIHSKKVYYMDMINNYLKEENIFLKTQIPELYDYSLDNYDFDDLTFVLIYRESNDLERKKNIINVLNYLHDIGIKNIVISEEDIYSRGHWLKNEFQGKFDTFDLVFTKGEELFSRSSAINEGIKESKTPYVFVSDNDVVLPKEVYGKSLSLIRGYYDFVFPFNRAIMDITDKEAFMENYDFNLINNEVQYRVTADGGFLACKKKSFIDSGAYNTNFKGWGGEDNEFVLRLNKSDFKLVRLDNVLYHFHHNKEKSEGSNVDLLKKSFNLSNFGDISLLINENQEIFDNYYRSTDFLNQEFSEESSFKVSIIMPICDVDEFLFKRCLNSLFNQTLGFENIELILIDDNSNKPSKDFVESYVNKYFNINYVYLDVKSGESKSRNIGLKFASADYVMFLDYDCYLLDDACDLLYNLILKDKSHLVIANYVDLAGGIGEMRSLDDDSYLISPTGNKIYSKLFILENGLKFFKTERFNDALFVEFCLSNSDKISSIDDPVLVIPIDNKFNRDFELEYLLDLIDIHENLQDNARKSVLLNKIYDYLFSFKLSLSEFKQIHEPLREICLINENVDEKYLNILNAITETDLLDSFNSYLEVIGGET